MNEYIILKSVKPINETLNFIPDNKDILIHKESGIIEKIGREIDVKNADVVNHYEDCLVMPGFIDPHVHFRYPGKEEAEDWNTGSLAALSAGITTVLDMPNNSPAIIDEKSLQIKLAHIREKSRINYGVFGGLTSGNMDFLLGNKDIKAIKVYMASTTGDLLINKIQNLNFSDQRKVFSFHAEDEQIIKSNEAAIGKITTPWQHSEIRSEASALKAVREVIEIYKKTRGNFHIAHVSTVAEIRELQNSGVSFECAPHHLFCSTDNYNHGGFLWKCNPPLRNPETQKLMIEALHEEKIQMIATDHAPHTLADKEMKEKLPASGIPSLEVGTHFILNEMAKGRISIPYAARILSTNSARRFQIEKRGEVKEGFFADLAIVDTQKEWTFQQDSIFSKCGWSPFLNNRFSAKVIATFVNGREYQTNTLYQLQKTKSIIKKDDALLVHQV